MHSFLVAVLALHITGGTIALFAGFSAIVTSKGGKAHRLAGRVYFWSMTAVFLSVVTLAIAHDNHFLLTVGFFSYYMVVRGYRILYLKKLGRGQKATPLDWGIMAIAGLFIGYLLWWGVFAALGGDRFGIVAIVFGSLGARAVFQDILKFTRGPRDKMHWWYDHINGMGGAYIATLTAVVVVNVQMAPGWVWWLLPAAIGVPVIRYTIWRYRPDF
ncbi:hypothetical protein [Dinghuibacter silviterrae]|uniref:Uncharacterized protein n=1 Tax=Dinghuibacter silviterrae TaxID=1539049 RepID=A0A4R8DI09_9BACT|nr:hypothetical protein [Dinghuibacter silviterrae]TDW97177.1 hypothetical protein EDB95_5021 [Dinghuibacter silviterrae]